MVQVEISWEGTNPAEIAAMNLPQDGNEYVLVKAAPGNTLTEITQAIRMIPVMEQALQAKTLWGKVFGVMGALSALGVGG